MRVSIVFQLKTSKKKPDGSCPVYVRFTLNRKRVELSTRLSVHVDSWDSVRQRMDGKSENVKVVNNRLDKISSKILDYYNQLEAGQEEFSVYDIKNKLCDIEDEHTLFAVFDFYIDTIKANIGKGYSEGTLKHYKTAKNRLESFLEDRYRKKDISLNNIDYKFINNFDIYLKEEYHNGINTVSGVWI